MARPIRIEYAGALYHVASRGDYLMKDIADEFNVHYSTVSRAIKKAEMRDRKTRPFFLFFLLMLKNHYD